MNVPNFLFKYVGSQSAAENCLRGTLKFTPINELNDPLELQPSIDWNEVHASLKVLRKEGFNSSRLRWLKGQEHLLDKLAPGFRAFDAPDTVEDANESLSRGVYENEAVMMGYLERVSDRIRSTSGVLSLTESSTSLPMWAHYGQNGDGFLVKFKNLQEVFGGSETMTLNSVTQIKYEDVPCGYTFEPETVRNLFFTKQSDWSYEREWRVVLPLEDCRQITPAGLYMHDIDPAFVEGVTCGWAVSENTVGSLQSNFPLKSINRATLFRGRVQINQTEAL